MAITPLRQGGTGSKSETPDQPEILPKKYESGTLNGAKTIPNLIMYGSMDINEQVPIVSFEFKGVQAGDVGKILDEKYNIACRAGLHCAPDAHRTLGTFNRKLVRFSFSFFNISEEVDYALNSLRQIAADLPKN